MTLSPGPRTLLAPPATAFFRIFGYTFGVASHSARALRFLGRLYGSTVGEDLERTEETFGLKRQAVGRGSPWEVYFQDQRLASALSFGVALNRLEYEICLRIIASQPDLIALHGATVLTQGGAAFLSGPSGAGKTTLSLSLAARGYQVGGDDVALLEPRSGTIRPVPRCFHLDARSRRLLRGTGLPMPKESLRYAFMTPADLGITAAPASSIRLILFLGRAQGRRPELTELSQAEMIVRLLSETPRGAHSAADIMAVLKPMVTGAACYQLLRGRLAETAETVAALLGPPSEDGLWP